MTASAERSEVYVVDIERHEFSSRTRAKSPFYKHIEQPAQHKQFVWRKTFGIERSKSYFKTLLSESDTFAVDNLGRTSQKFAQYHPSLLKRFRRTGGFLSNPAIILNRIWHQKLACCMSKKLYYFKITHNFRKENAGGTNSKETKKARKFQKFRQ